MAGLQRRHSKYYRKTAQQCVFDKVHALRNLSYRMLGVIVAAVIIVALCLILRVPLLLIALIPVGMAAWLAWQSYQESVDGRIDDIVDVDFDLEKYREVIEIALPIAIETDRQGIASWAKDNDVAYDDALQENSGVPRRHTDEVYRMYAKYYFLMNDMDQCEKYMDMLRGKDRFEEDFHIPLLKLEGDFALVSGRQAMYEECLEHYEHIRARRTIRDLRYHHFLTQMKKSWDAQEAIVVGDYELAQNLNDRCKHKSGNLPIDTAFYHWREIQIESQTGNMEGMAEHVAALKAMGCEMPLFTRV